MPMLFKNHSLAELTYLRTRFNNSKSPGKHSERLTGIV